MTSAPAIGFEYRPSAWPRRIQALVGALAACAVIVSALPGWLKLALVIAAIASVLAGRRVSTEPPVAVGWSAQAGWTWRTRQGDDRPAALRSWRIVGSAIVLRLAHGSTLHTMWLLPDNCDEDTRRRLRMRLATLRPDAESADH